MKSGIKKSKAATDLNAKTFLNIKKNLVYVYFSRNMKMIKHVVIMFLQALTLSPVLYLPGQTSPSTMIRRN